jgi:hypothetical protein
MEYTLLLLSDARILKTLNGHTALELAQFNSNDHARVYLGD